MTEFAIIGMACRFPGAGSVGEYWANLLGGHDAVTRGLGPVRDDWVAATARIADAYDFDPALFGISPKEALITDPQQRLFLKTAAEALDDAGIDPARTEAAIGVFGGSGRNAHEPMVRAAGLTGIDDGLIEIGHDKDHLCARVSFRLGLTGPSLAVQTACSTGLVAVHQGCLSLAAYDCDVVVAGAAAIRVPEVTGYPWHDGGIGSPDGFCRPFAAGANGTVPGDGVGIVVLQRLDDALAAGRVVHAVIRGSAINNDGSKSGYSSVSVAAQQQLMTKALAFAGAEPAEVGVVEAHGSGTILGDATEWAALERVYGRGPGPGPWVGSVKSSVGHLREAAGMAGLIKAALMARHGVIPATLHTEKPADFVTTGDARLRLASESMPWTDRLRTAAVTSLGLGGTNVHLLLTAAPEPERADSSDDNSAQIVVLSAPSAAALRLNRDRLGAYLSSAVVDVADVAHTSQQGRRRYPYRSVAVGRNAAELRADLAEQRVTDDEPCRPGNRRVAFVFTGAGDHYQGMGAGLSARLPAFRRQHRELLDLCGGVLGYDLREVALGSGPAVTGGGLDLRRMLGRTNHCADPIYETVNAHASLFCFQLALADSLRRMNVEPVAVIGYSIGELTAAAYAGVLDVENALRVVMHRAKLVAAEPPGRMLTVALGPDEAREVCEQHPDVWVAIETGSRSTVLAGRPEAVDTVQAWLADRDVPVRPVPSQRAFHTPMLSAAGSALIDELRGIQLSEPGVPMVGNVTGDWLAGEMREPEYWGRQLTSTVLFRDGLRHIAGTCDLLVEVGAGHLRSVVSQEGPALADTEAVPTVRRSYDLTRDDVVLGRAAGALWRSGVPIDFSAFASRAARTVQMPPTVGVERRFAVDPLPEPGSAAPVTRSWLDVLPPPPAEPTVSEEYANDAEKKLADLWVQLLGVRRPRLRDHFFDLGGDSLLGTRLIASLSAHYGFDVPAQVVFRHATLAAMAAEVQRWFTEREEA